MNYGALIPRGEHQRIVRPLPGIACLTIAAALAASVHGAVSTRHYDFERGTAGESASSAVDVIAELLLEDPSDAVWPGGHFWVEVAGSEPRHIRGGNLQESVTEAALVNPALEPRQGMATYVDVSNGSDLDSPAVGSQLALYFDGDTFYDDADTGAGSRGVYIQPAAFENGDPVVNGENVSESFNLVTQAWVRPSSEGKGIDRNQTVWQAGGEQGSVNINVDGFWEFDDLSSVGVLNPNIPVEYDAWTHLGIYRGGNGAEAYLNGELVAGDRDPTTSGLPANWFGGFASLITLGGDAAGSDGFLGLVDDFKVMGTADVSVDPLLDMDYWQLECDFNGDQLCDTADIDALMTDAETGGTGTDLTGDGIVDEADRDRWLALAGTENGFSGAFLLGDANLDGSVNPADLNAVGLNWRDAAVTEWSKGNFAIGGDGVDPADLNAVGINWQATVPEAAAAAVPEPSSAILLLGGLVAMMLHRRK